MAEIEEKAGKIPPQSNSERRKSKAFRMPGEYVIKSYCFICKISETCQLLDDAYKLWEKEKAEKPSEETQKSPDSIKYHIGCTEVLDREQERKLEIEETKKMLAKMERLTGRINLTDEEALAANKYFLSFDSRTLEIFTRRYGIDAEKPPFSKDTLEIFLSYLKKTKNCPPNRPKDRPRRAPSLREYIEPEEDNKQETEL